MAYNRRDQIGHWVTKEQRTQRPCTHACCRGYRAHPKNYPIILPDRTLRRATDEDLQAHFHRVSRSETPSARKAEAQILHEMARRDREEDKRNARATARAARSQEREVEYERIKLDAEARTNGHLVNATGRARGISDAEILTGREDIFHRYATDEARDYFAAHPRPTASHFRGKDTRVVERATEYRRKKRGVVSRHGGGRTGGQRGGPGR
jgi:hypothetical protein